MHFGCLILFLGVLVKVCEFHIESFHSVLKGNSTVLECNSSTDGQSNWKYQDDHLFVNRLPRDQHLKNTHLLFRNYSLLLKKYFD